MISYNNKIFQSISNADSGEVSGETLFHYWQEGNVIWATYKGGSILFGTITGKVDRTGKMEFRYQHLSKDRAFRTGKCISTPEILENGKIRLHENWHWTSGKKGTGESIIEEI